MGCIYTASPNIRLTEHFAKLSAVQLTLAKSTPLRTDSDPVPGIWRRAEARKAGKLAAPPPKYEQIRIRSRLIPISLGKRDGGKQQAQGADDHRKPSTGGSG